MNALTIFILCGLSIVVAFIVWAANTRHRPGITIYPAGLDAAADELARARAERAAERIVAAGTEVAP